MPIQFSRIIKTTTYMYYVIYLSLSVMSFSFSLVNRVSGSSASLSASYTKHSLFKGSIKTQITFISSCIKSLSCFLSELELQQVKVAYFKIMANCSESKKDFSQEQFKFWEFFGCVYPAAHIT